MTRPLGPDGPALELPAAGPAGTPKAPLARLAATALRAAFLLLVLILSGRSASALPVVSEVRVGERGALTRVILTLSAKVKYQAFTLQDPHRVVVDLPEVRWIPRADTPGPAESVVDRIRLGRFNRDTSRIVIDCRTPVSVRDISLQPVAAGGYRLLIDMAPSAAAGSRSAKEPTMVGGGEMRPVIGATALPGGDLAPDMAGRPGDPAAMGTTFAAPKPRPHVSASSAVPPWVVAIDAGHGDQDPGAISPNGVYEKRITLATARALRDELKALGRFRVVLTRDRDIFIPLRRRIAIAHAAGADLFISLHADKADNPATRGLSVYTLSEQASDAEAAALAEKENRVDMLGGFRLKGEAADVTNILIDLVQRDTKNQSAQFASLLMRELGEETMFLPKTHRFAGFAVLKAPDIPSVLIELGFLSNPTDERLLRDPAHRQRLARGIARAVDSYFVRFEARNRY